MEIYFGALVKVTYTDYAVNGKSEIKIHDLK